MFFMGFDKAAAEIYNCYSRSLKGARIFANFIVFANFIAAVNRR